MYISNMTHFLDEKGNIPKQMPKEARELANFLAFVVEETTTLFPGQSIQTGIRCFQPGCSGQVTSELKHKKDEISWKCSQCDNAGRINSWQKTKWDNSGEK